MGKWIQRLLLLAMLAVVAVNALAAWIAYDYNRPGPLLYPQSLIVPRGQGFRATARALENQGIIRNSLTLQVVAFVLHKAHLFKAGEYVFPPGISAHAVMDMVVEGRVTSRRITVPEGYTVQEVIGLLNREPALTGEVTGDIPEGSLLPDTYLFMYGDSRQEVLRQMRGAMDRVLAHLWETRQQGLPLDTPQEALTLASIVEKETGVRDERPLVASVFINRLRKGIRLQSDPTVVYGLLKKDGKPLGRALMLSDLKIETPYNTYVIDRLPPGPIANPGKAALEAVLNPPDTDYLYFVATGSGGHHFATSLKEHNHNVSEYRKVLKKARVEENTKKSKIKKP